MSPSRTYSHLSSTATTRTALTSTPAALVVLVSLVSLVSGCQDRTLRIEGRVTEPDGGSRDGATDRVTPGSGGAAGGMGGLGGGSGGVGGSGGAGGACVPGRETCGDVGLDNDCDGDKQDVDATELVSTAHCGACFRQCNQANAENISCVLDPVTQVGRCSYTCASGFRDVDGEAANGCECQVASPDELCNSRDDNCDGRIDEGFDLAADVTNCGRCGGRCEYPFAQAECNAGQCRMAGCLAGFYDANGNPADGCECQRTSGGQETCDGIDNDCDGMIDEPTDLVGRPACRTGGVCTGVVAQCMGAMGWSCTYPASYQEAEDMARGCDSLDNDCDGRADEAFEIGRPCTIGSGACSATGVWVCNGMGGRRCNAQPVTPQPEICDGLDNDCDGKVDEIESEANRTSDERLVYFAARNVTMFAYEASRYDATATNVGFDSTARPCSVAGRQPWASITKEDAAAACARVGTGWRLCTRDEWFDACNGSANSTFPYGNTYSMTACVGYDYTAPQPNTQPAATGSATMCVSDLSTAAGDELFDMSGNVKEWVLTTVSPAAYEMRGGAYDIASFVETTGRRAPGMECAASTGAPTQPVRLPALGFRCCLPGRLPAN